MFLSNRLALSVGCTVLLALTSAPARGEEVILSDVPAYEWYHGCSPTAGMMIMGYWDAYGYSALIPGSNSWSSNKSAIQNAIASPEHVADYALCNGVNDEDYSSPYTDKSELGGAHGNNCLADFMHTSFSSEELTYGSTWNSKFGGGMEACASWRAYSFTAGGDYSSMPTWADFTKGIKFGRPMELGVDTDGDGEVDHSVTAIGYRDTSGYREYACRDTWNTSSIPRWERFRAVSGAYDWGIEGMNTFRPAGVTKDTAVKVTSGNWNAGSSWDNGVPDGNAYVYIPQGSTVTVNSLSQAKLLNNYGTINVQGDVSTNGMRCLGPVIQTSGSVAVDSSLAVGDATYTLQGGQVTVGDKVMVVRGGQLEWLGGTLTAPLVELQDYDSKFIVGVDCTVGDGMTIMGYNRKASLRIRNGATVTHASGFSQVGTVCLGITQGSGTYQLGPSGELQAYDLYVGYDGTGFFEQTGGTLTIINHIVLGDRPGSAGTFELHDGNVSVDDYIYC